jgi:hypothetical protein
MGPADSNQGLISATGRKGPAAWADGFAPGGGTLPERSGHRAHDCRGIGYLLVVFGFGPVTWAWSARV